MTGNASSINAIAISISLSALRRWRTSIANPIAATGALTITERDFTRSNLNCSGIQSVNVGTIFLNGPNAYLI